LKIKCHKKNAVFQRADKDARTNRRDETTCRFHNRFAKTTKNIAHYTG